MLKHLAIRTLVFCVIVAATLSETALPLDAQDTAGPTIRAETRVVLVDAVTVDKKGKFIRDLAAKDFRVWEDGKEQKIAGFSLEHSGVSPERPAAHYIAMFFDTSAAGQANQITVRQQGVRFVDGFASPDRYMAVVNYNVNGGFRIVQSFTTDRDQLRKALSQVPAGWNTIPMATGSAAAVDALRSAGRGSSLPRAATPANDTFAYHDMLASVRSLANSLATVRGRKALVLFSGGIPPADELLMDAQLTIQACNKANVAIYTVDPGAGDNSGRSDSAPSAGIPGIVATTMKATVRTDDRSLTRSLAEGTGGSALTVTNDLANSLGKIAQEQDEYYLLAYTPTVDSAEGSCHDLRVKVDRGDLDVRARKSYCTAKPVDGSSGKPEGKDLETRAANDTGGNMTAKMQLPWFYSAPNIAQVSVAMDIIPAGMKFQKEKGKLHGEFQFAGVAYTTAGSAAARVGDSVKLDFDSQQQVDAFLKTPYHYQNQFDIAPGQYTFRMAFGSDSSGAHGFGKIEMPLTVDPWNGQKLAISGLALSHDVHPATDLAAGLDAALLEGARPLVARGTEAVPTGTAQFHVGEPGYFYFEAYEPLLAAAKPDAPLPLVGMRVRILDRATGQQKQDTGIKSAGIYERAGNPVIPILANLPAANLSPGAYRLEVSIVRETGASVVRIIDFDIT